jgi:acyl-CoA thioester hydrolase
MGIARHGTYLKYFEPGRTRLFGEVGLSNEILQACPFQWVVIESKVRHVSPLAFGDRVRVDAWLKDIEYRVHIAYEVFNATAGQMAARGHTMLATLKREGRLLIETPPELLRYLTEQDV